MPGNKVGAGNTINAPGLKEVPETRQERCWLAPNKRRNRRAAWNKKGTGNKRDARNKRAAENTR
jgi:hypothetical protein